MNGKRPILLKAIVAVAFFAMLAIVPLTISSESDASSGSFEKVNWNLDEYTGQLTITGNGAIPDSAFMNNWDIRSVTIGFGIMEIGSGAFDGLTFYDGETVLTYDQLPGKTFTGAGDGKLYLVKPTVPDVSVGDEFSVDGMTYSVVKKKPLRVSPMGCETVPENLVVPSTVSYGGADFAVTSVAENAFADAYGLRTVVLGDNVIKVNVGAFAGCTDLESVAFPASLAKVYVGAFDANFHNGTKVIGYSAKYLAGKTFSGTGGHLYQNGSVANRTVVDTGDMTFKVVNMDPMRVSLTGALDGVTDLVVPSTVYAGGCIFEVTSVAADAFAGRSELRTVVLGPCVSNVYAGAFAGCSGLESIEFPATLTKVYAGAFDVDFHNGTKVIGYSAKFLAGKTFTGSGGHLYQDGSITNHAVIKVGTMTFKVVNMNPMRVSLTGAEGTHVEVPSTVSAGGCTFDVTSVYKGAFEGCKNLSFVSLGDNVTHVYSGAFTGCTGLQTVIFPGSLQKVYADSFDCTFLQGDKELPMTASALRGHMFDVYGSEYKLVI